MNRTFRTFRFALSCRALVARHGLTLAVATAAGLAGLAVATAAPLHLDGFEDGLCAWSGSLGGGIGTVFVEPFAAPEDAAWPAPWVVAGGVAQQDVVAGRGRLRPQPSGYSLARMHAPLGVEDAEVTFTLRFDDATTQGVGFYLRQNGGHLQLTNPSGSGYAAFVEGTFRGQPGIGLWKEENGSEIELAHGGGADLEPASGVDYRVRFRVTQIDPAATRLQAKLWPAAESEPTAWTVAVDDATASLQEIAGGIAVDSWSSIGSPGPITAFTHVDDVVVESLCNPLGAMTPLSTVVPDLVFAEGPLWRDDHLLFTDLDADTIYRLDPPATLDVWLTPSDTANGLALAPDGALLAAEHATRRVSRTDPLSGLRASLVDDYQGASFNSPNDLAVRHDGTIYFTDPDYGLADPPAQRQLAFNGLFRRSPDGTLVAEWEGVVGSNEPNGVALSPDEATLYVTDTQAGTLRAWTVAADGALTEPRILVGGLATPDGLCIDTHGNLWVATWGDGLVVVAPNGARWGELALPASGTNCAFGGADAHTLYVTVLDRLLAGRVAIPGQW